MRKVTQEAVSAFQAGRNYRNGATRVVQSSDGVVLLLHGSIIAKDEGDGLQVSLAGYPTKTARERLNGLPGVRVNQVEGVQYLNGVPIPEDGFVTVCKYSEGQQ
jgi:hypothetical protein